MESHPLVDLDPPKKVVVCTFATEEYAGSAEVLRHTALHVGGADRVEVFREADVGPWFERHPELRSDRGYGWWSWKPFVIAETMRRTRPGDVVVYCDAAMAFEAPIAPYAEAAADVLLFRLGEHETKDYRNGTWTKPDALADCPASADVPQVNAALQVYRHTPRSIDFLKKWMDRCSKVELMDDMHRVTPAPPEFRQHRHDQSALTTVAFLNDSEVMFCGDPTQYGRGDTLEKVCDTPLVDHHRKRLHPVKIAVITATTGGEFLEECVRSVQAQTIPNVDHYVVVDGPEHEARVRSTVNEFEGRGVVKVVTVPQNVGSGGWNGHRVYGAMPWLVDPRTDFVAFLDDDNRFDPDHLRDLAKAVVGGRVPWGFSLRRIVDAAGRDVCPDNCESLGGICPTVNGPSDRLIDTSCYLVNRELAIAASPNWNHRFRNPAGTEADRELAKWLLSSAPHVCVRSHSLQYRVGSSSRSVTADFFKRGNELMGYDFAAKPDLYVFHFSAEATARFLATRRKRDRSYALDEWQMTLLNGLDASHNLLDGYACAPNIPPGAVVYVSMCMPDSVPWSLLEERRDLWKIGYTLESPNIRHSAQWDPVLLAKHFDVVLTYWTPLLEDPRVRTVRCAHNTHHLDLDDPLDRQNLRTNEGTGRSCAMVLERRDLSGAYQVPNTRTKLRCLDPLRETLVRDLEDVTVFGTGWDSACRRNPGIKLGHALHRSRDPRSSVDILSEFTFALIVENCDAEGYVSEKLYDALMAGCVPLYYGNSFLDIPEGADDGVYLDLKAFFGSGDIDSRKLRDFLGSLTDDRVAAWKRRVADRREAVLRQVDVHSFAGAVRGAIEMRA